MIADSAMKRLGTVEEVAPLDTWLYTDASRFNTGAVFDMSGGPGTRMPMATTGSRKSCDDLARE